MIPLTEKYRPKKLSEIIGQEAIVSQVTNFYRTFPMKKAIILNGAVGTGKTTIALALANEFNLELFELNASDLRDRTKLEEILKPATSQSSLFKKGKIILVDEADGITASDRGGLPELLVLIEKTSFPIIITSNDIWQQKFSLLRKKCQLINLKELDESIISKILNRALEKEGAKISQKTVSLIAKKTKGDARAALNDLQVVLINGEESYLSDLIEREKEESIFVSLKKVFQSPVDEKIITVYDNTHMELDEILLWVEENIPSEYKGKALAKAYESLSKADVFKGRIYRQQYWRFLVYQNFFLSAGIAAATKIKTSKFTGYTKPSRILKIWLSNQKNAKRKSIIEKYAKSVHMSKKKAMKESFLLPLIIQNQAIKELDLNEEEQTYLQDKKGAIIVSSQLNKFRINED